MNKNKYVFAQLVEFKCYHLGIGRNPIAKTTFASANQNRDYRIFEDFAFFMLGRNRQQIFLS